MNMRKYHGFTLVEMAIVVVLAGILLTAGVMAGRGMISRAQTQDVLKIIGDLQGAATSFKQRYGTLPGDWVFVANQMPTATAGGDGDGIIEDTISAAGLATAGQEIELAIQHLYYSGMIGKMGSIATQRLQSKFGPVHMGQNVAGNTNATYPAAFPSVRNVIIFVNLPCEAILEVDRVLDDGDSATGRAQSSLAPAACPAGGTAARYFVPL
jgi:prepilin-type N-terminal cleavage/methylation domain-containing protein